MDWLETKKKNKSGLATLQLAPLIDIFVLIIVFLIKGTVLGGVQITTPFDFYPAKSVSKENMDVAPEVYLGKSQVVFKMLNREIAISGGQVVASDLESFKGLLADYILKVPAAQKKSGVLVNLVADRSIQYESIFEMTLFLRQAGFQSILLVAEGSGQGNL